MGAIVWAGIALWYTYEQIIQFREDTKLRKIADVRLGLPSMVYGAVYGEKFLHHLDVYTQWADFKDTILPFRCVATCVDDSQTVVLENWNIAQAVRASAGFPWVFASYTIWEKSYIDGCLWANLPISFAKGERIIASTVRWPYLTFDESRNPLKQAESLFAISLKLQEEKELLLTDAEMMLISPDVSRISTFDFTDTERVIEQGYKKAIETIF